MNGDDIHISKMTFNLAYVLHFCFLYDLKGKYIKQSLEIYVNRHTVYKNVKSVISTTQRGEKESERKRVNVCYRN